MAYHEDQHLVHFSFLLYILNDLPDSADVLQFRIFSDDTNKFYSSKKLDLLQTVMNDESVI